MPFPIETTAARRDAFVVHRATFFQSHRSHLVSSVFDLAGVPASCAVRAAQMAICSPKLRMNRMAPTKSPVARSRFCQGARVGRGVVRRGSCSEGKTREGRTTPAIAEVNAVILDANALVPWCSPGSGERTPCRLFLSNP